MPSKLLLTCSLLLSIVIFGQSRKYWTPEQTMKMKNITIVIPSPDGSKVLYTVREAVQPLNF